MKHITCIEDLRQVHKRNVPKAFFDYADRGSYSEDTLRANVDDLQAIKFRQRILVDVSRRDLCDHHPRRARRDAADPGAGRARPACSTATAKSTPAARRRPRAFPTRLSTMSICSIEDVADNVDKPFWFQLYVMKDRGFIKALIERAIAAKCSALVLDRRSAGDRAASCRHQERPVGAAGMVAVETGRFRQQAGLGRRHAARQAPHLRQPGRPRQGHRRHRLAVGNGSRRSSTRR